MAKLNDPNYGTSYDAYKGLTQDEIFRHMGQINQARQPTKQERITALSEQIFRLTKELEKLTLDDPHPGPTNRQLRDHESLKNAWNEYLVVRKLVLGE